jgi:cytoskeletal protein RodZ
LEDLFPILVVLFLLFPFLEKLLKAGRQKGQQPPQRPQRRSQPVERQRLPDGRTMTTSQQAEEHEARDASDLLPAELWEILTGQKRQEAPQQQPEAPRPEASRPEPERPAPPVKAQRKTMADRRAEVERKRAQRMAAERGTTLSDEDAAMADLMGRRERTQATRRRYDHSAPSFASLETGPETESVRHAAFHARLDRLPKAARARRPSPVVFDLDLEDQSALQRAMLLQEVLGRPKGLDD